MPTNTEALIVAALRARRRGPGAPAARETPFHNAREAAVRRVERQVFRTRDGGTADRA